MNVCVIRLSMAATLDRAGRARFSKAALSGGSRPGHCEARRHEQPRARTFEAGAIRGRRLADDVAERAAEGAEALEADVEADLGHGVARLAQTLHGALHAPPLQITVRRLTERGAELA